MPNYKQSSSTGEVITYLAARGGRFENPYGGVPTLHFDEVQRTVLDGKLISEKPTGRRLSVAVQPVAATIPHINPETFEQILDEDGNPISGQSFTDQQFAYLMACAYIDAAQRDDARRSAPAPDPGKLPPNHPRRRMLDEDVPT